MAAATSREPAAGEPPPQVTLEVHFAVNHFLDTVASLCYVDEKDAEVAYQEVPQGTSTQQLSYPGHRWVVRGVASGELYLRHFTTAEALQVVVVGLSPPAHISPGVAVVWLLGLAPREDLLVATRSLLRLASNAHDRPADPAVRTVRRANAAIARLLRVDHAEDAMRALGFEPGADGATLSLPLGRAVDATSWSALLRLDRCLKGEAGQPAQTAPGAAARDGAEAAVERWYSHVCRACSKGIDNDVRHWHRQRASADVHAWRDSVEWNATGEFRYRCATCGNVDLCPACYDLWKAGDASVHPLDHAMEIIAPITSPWGCGGLGPPPTTPSLAARPRRGPFGR